MSEKETKCPMCTALADKDCTSAEDRAYLFGFATALVMVEQTITSAEKLKDKIPKVAIKDPKLQSVLASGIASMLHHFVKPEHYITVVENIFERSLCEEHRALLRSMDEVLEDARRVH